jgi:hypothetical protein
MVACSPRGQATLLTEGERRLCAAPARARLDHADRDTYGAGCPWRTRRRSIASMMRVVVQR